MIVRITDHADRAAGRLAQQFRGTNVESLVRIHATRTQGVEDAAHALIAGRSVFDATGATLDLVGKMVGLPRPYAWDEMVYDTEAEWDTGAKTKLASTAGTLTIGGSMPVFARTGPAYWDGVSYASGVPRFPSVNATRGVMVEELHQNLVQHSSQIDNAWWLKGGVTISPDAVSATLSTGQVIPMDKICETTGTGFHFINKSGLVAAASVYTISFFAKAAERSKIASGADGTTVFDLAAGTVALGTGISATITPKGDGAYFCVVTATAGNTGPYIFLHNGAGITYTGTDGFGAYIWGVDFIAKAYPLSPIPTSGSAVTVNAETLTVPTNGLLDPSKGSVIILAYVGGDQAAATQTANHILYDCGNVNANRLLLFAAAGTPSQWRFRTTNAASTASEIIWNQRLSEGYHMFVPTWSAAKTQLWVDGVKRGSINAPNIPAAIQPTAYHGSGNTGLNQWNHPQAYAIYYDRELSDAEIAAAYAGSLPPDFTAYLDFTGGSLTYRAAGSWVGPWRANSTDVAAKVQAVTQTIPAGASITIQHRVNDHASDIGASAWGNLADLSNKPFLQSRVLMDGYAGAVKVERLALTPGKPVPYDEAYRAQVLGQIVANTSNGRSEDLIGLLGTLGAEGLRLIEPGSATAIAQYSGTLLSDDAMTKSLAVKATPPIEVAIDQYTDTPFGFAEDPDAFGFGVGELARRL